MVKDIDTKFGNKKGKKWKHDENITEKLYKKRSIFFNLEYWKHLLVHHQLDVMHIFKNVCENIYGTLLHQLGKTNDEINARKYLEHLQIREKLVLDEINKNNKVLPLASYTLSKEEKNNFLKPWKV